VSSGLVAVMVSHLFSGERKLLGALSSARDFVLIGTCPWNIA
jgi:hypothetical protein